MLIGDPLVIDVTNSDGTDGLGDCVDHYLTTLNRNGCRAAVICHDPARIVRQLGSAEFEIVRSKPISGPGRVAAVTAAARGAGAYLTEEEAETISNRFPIAVDGLEQAMRLAASSPTDDSQEDPLVRRFIAVCRQLAVEGLSQLAERIEPVFRIEDVVLPADRKRQLEEIADHVRLASKVFDGWKFGEQLPYGRGVTALFFGPSGTGKTMAAMGVAHTLGVQLLRVDLSRIVSKYIGDTEKNIDRIFNDAQRSGSAMLIDEADALLGKRSEVKDAHDRYANIEVAYVLQRMEAYEGLAILTTNMRQNLDSAFLRRLRFIVEFPRPDVAAREQIWRFCLPDGSHELDQAAFRQLAQDRLDGWTHPTDHTARRVHRCCRGRADQPATHRGRRTRGVCQAGHAARRDRLEWQEGRMKHEALFNVTVALRDRLQSALSGASVPGTVFVGPLDDRDSRGAAHSVPLSHRAQSQSAQS